jgi:hypothetical protein
VRERVYALTAPTDISPALKPHLLVIPSSAGSPPRCSYNPKRGGCKKDKVCYWKGAGGWSKKCKTHAKADREYKRKKFDTRTKTKKKPKH